MSISAEIADLIRRVARISSPNLLLPVCDELEQLPADADFDHITSLLRHVQHADTRTCLLEIVSAFKSHDLQVNAASLSLALRSAIPSLESQGEETVLELVWSGPSKPFSTIRRTDQALADIIAESQQSILIVSFAVYKVPGIMNSLREAVD
ncbi:hypothetical protein TRIP_C20326 [Candidatus Zixiibacteriota bacterium]|nr:hypothetical protein TRIP_C20326 [candidate division Zixibacteria bacterium]